MGARNKLNAAHMNGILIVAGLAGLLSGSWLVFAVGFAILFIFGVHSGGIRPKR